MIILLLIFIFIIVFCIVEFNLLTKRKMAVGEAKSAIDVYLKQRFDLIPNLVETVKGYATHEEETFQNITEARAGISSASNIDELSKANDELTSAISRLNFVVENYPELKANQNFLDLQAQSLD